MKNKNRVPARPEGRKTNSIPEVEKKFTKQNINHPQPVRYEDAVNGTVKDEKQRRQAARRRRLLKSETKRVNNIRSAAAAKQYVHNAMRMKKDSERRMIILWALTIKTIKAKLGMPTNDEEYYRKSFNMQAAILANVDGYFTPAFGRLTT